MASDKILDTMLSYCKGNEFISFDLETTGRGNPCNYPYLKIIEIGAVKIKDGEIVDRFQSFVNPSIKIPKKIIELTAITDDMVKNAPHFSEALRSFKEFTGDLPLIAHNATFDSNFIYYYGDLVGIDFHENPLIDSLKLARKCFPKESNNLGALCERFGILQFDAHRADDDAEVLAEVFNNLVELLQEDINKASEPNYDALKVHKDKNIDDYQVTSANYWGKGDMARIYVTVRVKQTMYIDIFYDLKSHYWSFKNKEQRDTLIDFSIVNIAFKEYVNTVKPVLKQYLEKM